MAGVASRRTFVGTEATNVRRSSLPRRVGIASPQVPGVDQEVEPPEITPRHAGRVVGVDLTQQG